MSDQEDEKQGTISPFFSKDEKKDIRILAAHQGQSMRVWVREEIIKLVEKAKADGTLTREK